MRGLLLHVLTALLSGSALFNSCFCLRDLAQAPAAASTLAHGAGPYLQSQSQYSLFWQIVQKVNETGGQRFTGWFEGPTNETILAVPNEALRADFAQVAVDYGISDPNTFVDRLLSAANLTTDPRDGTSYPLTTGLAAGTVLIAFVGSHDLHSVQDFYNDTITKATYRYPVNVSIYGLGTGFDAYDTNLKAYGNTTVSYVNGNYSDIHYSTTVQLQFPEGILHFYSGRAALESSVSAAYNSLTVPQDKLVATGINSLGGQNITYPFDDYSYSNGLGTEPATLTVYELPGVFIFADQFGAADTPDYGADDSLRQVPKVAMTLLTRS